MNRKRMTFHPYSRERGSQAKGRIRDKGVFFKQFRHCTLRVLLSEINFLRFRLLSSSHTLAVAQSCLARHSAFHDGRRMTSYTSFLT
jgi:hypothetical protein